MFTSILSKKNKTSHLELNNYCQDFVQDFSQGVKKRYTGIPGAMWYDPPGSKLGNPGIYSVIRSK